MCRRPMQAKSAKRTFCTDACRARAYRRRVQGVPETFLSDGARPHGPVSLAAYRARIVRVTELLEMGVELKYEQTKWLLR
jgi:hypothetical protein